MILVAVNRTCINPGRKMMSERFTRNISKTDFGSEKFKNCVSSNEIVCHQEAVY